jgi:hypothetical protein
LILCDKILKKKLGAKKKKKKVKLTRRILFFFFFFFQPSKNCVSNPFYIFFFVQSATWRDRATSYNKRGRSGRRFCFSLCPYDIRIKRPYPLDSLSLSLNLALVQKNKGKKNKEKSERRRVRGGPSKRRKKRERIIIPTPTPTTQAPTTTTPTLTRIKKKHPLKKHLNVSNLGVVVSFIYSFVFFCVYLRKPHIENISKTYHQLHHRLHHHLHHHLHHRRRLYHTKQKEKKRSYQLHRIFF